MSKIEQLIQQHCPDGVEYKNVKDVISEAFWIMPSTPKFVDNSDIPYITSKNLRKRSIDFTNIKYISNDDYVTISRQRPILENDILIGMIGTIGEIAKVGVFDFKFYGQNMYLLRLDESIIDINFFVHFFDSPFVKSKLNSVKNSSSQGYLKAEHIEKIQIPIPPLPIQQEIVTILDKFTALEAELEAELEARSRQYEYYRNQLLAFEGAAVEWKTLGEVAFYPKKRISYDNVNLENYVGVENLLQNKQGKTFSSYVPSSGNLIQYLSNDILIGNIRPYLKKIWVSDINGGTNGDVLVIRIQEEFSQKIKSRYLFYLLSSDDFFKYSMQFAKGAKMPRGDKDAILKFKIPIPSLEDQERIVNILDQFDALVNDIKTGLPAEIKARRAQYEYYRKKLLTFNRVTV